MKMEESQQIFSDNEDIDPKAHQQLLDGIGRINRSKQYIKHPTRFETTLKSSEFNLVKTKTEIPVTVRHNTVAVNELVDILTKTSKHIQLGQKLKSVQKNKKTLKKPLEKPVAERIERKIKYDKARNLLSRWDAVVTKNKSAEQLSFPLKDEEMQIIESQPREPFSFRVKSDLMNKLEIFTPKLEKTETEEKAPGLPLTLKEMLAKRREMARMRVKESYQIAKSRQTNKIKSKNYHRLLKREKMKKQMKDFEKLQKEDPEAALNQLELIEKNRIEERVSLRHKNTGTWAKNLQMRAKYNKDVRQELSEQLAISRDLTKKRKLEESSCSEDEEKDDEEEQEQAGDPFNPWVKKTVKKTAEVEEFETGYRKYWETRNKNEKETEEFINNNTDIDTNSTKNKGTTGDWEIQEIVDESNEKKTEIKKPLKKKKENLKGTKKSEKSDKKKNKILKDEVNEKRNKKSIDDMFDEFEDNIESKIEQKLSNIRKDMESTTENKRKLKSSKEYKITDLSFKNNPTRPVLDEELNEINKSDDENKDDSNDFNTVKKMLSSESNENENEDDIIDPNKFITVKRRLKTALPDMVNMDENIDDDPIDLVTEKRMTIAEAFEEDDIVADFAKEKEVEAKKDIQEDINLTLPGWGSWAGTGITKSATRNKRFILKLPKELPRRDDNKERVIINEDGNNAMKSHMVSQLPFPFTSVKDYEASIRAPIGTTFVPESAHRAYTRPPIQTKLGTIINPMDENSLVQNNIIKSSIARSKTGKKMLEMKE